MKRFVLLLGLILLLSACQTSLNEGTVMENQETNESEELLEEESLKTPVLNFVEDYFEPLHSGGEFEIHEEGDYLKIFANFESHLPSPFWEMAMCHQNNCYLPRQEISILRTLEKELQEKFLIDGIDFYYSVEKDKIHVYSKGQYIYEESLIRGVSRDGSYVQFDFSNISEMVDPVFIPSGEYDFFEPLIQNMNEGYKKGQFCEEGSTSFENECCILENETYQVDKKNDVCVQRVENGDYLSSKIEFEAVDSGLIEYLDQVEVEEGVFLYVGEIEYAEEELAQFDYDGDNLETANYLVFNYLHEETGIEVIVKEIKPLDLPYKMFLEGFYYTPQMKGVLAIYSGVHLGYGWYSPTTQIFSQVTLNEALKELYEKVSNYYKNEGYNEESDIYLKKSKEVGLKYQFPRLLEIEEYEKALMDMSFSPGFIYPIGWSEDGKLAYLMEYSSEDSGLIFREIFIQDLITDERKTLIDLPEYYLGIWQDKHQELAEALEEDRIVPQLNWKLQRFPFEHNGDIYDIEFELETVDLEEAYFNDLPKKANIFLTSKEKGKKTVADWRNTALEEADEPWYSSVVHDIGVIGFLQSPYEDRIAILIYEENRGWEGPPHVRSIKIIGADLTTGFE